MSMDSTIDSLANLMIEKYGENASFTAAERSRIMRACGDMQTSRAWRLISRRIDMIAPPLPKIDADPWPENIDQTPSASDGQNLDSSVREKLAEDPELVT